MRVNGSHTCCLHCFQIFFANSFWSAQFVRETFQLISSFKKNQSWANSKENLYTRHALHVDAFPWRLRGLPRCDAIWRSDASSKWPGAGLIAYKKKWRKCYWMPMASNHFLVILGMFLQLFVVSVFCATITSVDKLWSELWSELQGREFSFWSSCSQCENQ